MSKLFVPVPPNVEPAILITSLAMYPVPAVSTVTVYVAPSTSTSKIAPVPDAPAYADVATSVYEGLFNATVYVDAFFVTFI